MRVRLAGLERADRAWMIRCSYRVRLAVTLRLGARFDTKAGRPAGTGLYGQLRNMNSVLRGTQSSERSMRRAEGGGDFDVGRERSPTAGRMRWLAPGSLVHRRDAEGLYGGADGGETDAERGRSVARTEPTRPLLAA